MTLAGLIQRYRRWRLACLGVKLDRSCVIGRDVSVGPVRRTVSPGELTVGTECEIGTGNELDPRGGRIRIGRNVFLGPYVVIYGHGGVEIGDHSLVSMHCVILSSNHFVPGRAKLIRNEPDVLLPTRIGRDVWLGAGVRVLGGVTIGDGCVVGAGAVVARDLPAYSICVGVPARVIGNRE